MNLLNEKIQREKIEYPTHQGLLHFSHHLEIMSQILEVCNTRGVRHTLLPPFL